MPQGELSDAEVFGTASPPQQQELTDEQVFGKKELTDAEVFGAAAAKPAEAQPGYASELGRALARGLGGFAVGEIKGRGIEESGQPIGSLTQALRQAGMPEGIVQEQQVREQEQPPEISTPRPPEQDPLFRAGQYLEDKIRQNFASRGVLNPTVEQIAESVGSGLGSIGQAIAYPPSVMYVPATGVTEAYDEAVQKGATPEQARKAAEQGAIAGATELVDVALPFVGTIAKVGGLFAKVGVRALQSAFAEGGQEYVGKVIQNAIAKGIYDPNRDIFEGATEQGLIAAAAGAILGGAIPHLGGHKPGPVATEQQIAAAGQQLTQEQPAPPLAQPQQQELPLGPPTAQAELPLGGPSGPMAQLVDTEVAKLRAAGDLTPAPSDSEAIVRGRGVADLLQSDIVGKGPLETRPGDVQIDMTPATDQAAGGIPLSREGGRLVKMGQQLSFPYDRVNFRALHSTTLGGLLPNVSLTHLEGKPVQQGAANALVQGLMLLNPNQPVHIVTDQDMRRVSGGGGLYHYFTGEIATPGKILIAASELNDPARFAYVLLHEGTHSATSKLIMENEGARARVRLLMDAAQKHLPPEYQGREEEDYLRKLSDIDRKLYAFGNEREFLAEAFTFEEFQNWLRQHQTPREVTKALGLEGKMTLWQSFVHTVRQILGLPDNRPTMSLLEAALRVGSQVADQQAAEIAAMQAKFNKVEPQLDAVKRQPETKGVYDMISGLRDHIPADMRDEVARQAGYADKMNVFYKYMLHAFQLGELNPHVADLQRYLEKMREAGVEESKINDAAMRIMKDWDNIGRVQAEALTNFIDDITNMVYRSNQEIAQGISRKPTTAEFNALAKKYKLSAEALDVFQRINKMFDTFLNLTSGLALQEAMKITDPVQRAKAVDAVNANVRSLRARPYFPFMRYGRHVVLVKNARGVVVHREHFERRGLRSARSFQEAAAVKLRSAFPAPQYTIDFDVLSESSGPMVGTPTMMLDLMAQKLKLSDSQLKALEQLRFEMAPAQSFRHRFQHKSYVKGYSRDFQRSFAQYFFHGAKWYTKVKYADAMRGDIARVRAGRTNSLTPVKRVELANFLEDHLENNFLNPKQDFIHFKAGLVLWTLAYVPVSAAVNMSQVPMVSLPYLGAKFGDARAALRLGKAIGFWRNYYTKGKIETMTSDHARAIDYAIKTGRLEQTLGAELAAWAQGGNLGVGYGGSTTARAVHEIVQKGMWMFSIAEKWNRRITFSAARELALAQPNSKFVRDTVAKYQDELATMVKSGYSQHEAEAILVASHVVDQTQFMGSQESRPRFMRGKLGTLFLYKRFTQGLLFLTLNNKRDFAPRFMLMALMMAGLQGLPGYDDLKEIARALGWWLYGKDFDLNREIKRLVREMTNEEWAPGQVLHGFARIGFGVPWLLNAFGNAMGQSPTVNAQTGWPHGPDLSRSIGLGGAILPIEVGKLFGPPINEPEKMFAEQSARAGGVMGNLAYNWYRAAMSKDQPGDFKRWELMMPRAAKNLSSAYRAYSEEKVRGKNDTAIVRFDTRDPEHLGEIFGMAGGFQPRRVTAKWEELRDQSEVTKFFETGRSMILEQYAAAVRAGSDPKEMERVNAAREEFNANLPQWAKAMSLSADTIKRSIEMRLRTQQLQEAGLAQQKNRILINREMQRLNPEAAVDVRKIPAPQ